MENSPQARRAFKRPSLPARSRRSCHHHLEVELEEKAAATSIAEPACCKQRSRLHAHVHCTSARSFGERKHEKSRRVIPVGKFKRQAQLWGTVLLLPANSPPLRQLLLSAQARTIHNSPSAYCT